MEELLISSPGAGVMVVDWRKGANHVYTQAVANLRVVARQLTYVIRTVNVSIILSQLEAIIMTTSTENVPSFCGVPYLEFPVPLLMQIVKRKPRGNTQN